MRFSAKEITGSSIVLLVLLLGFTAIHGNAASSADQLLREAYEKRMEARRAHCTTIGEKIAACYASGDSEKCDTLQGSLTWFFNEYGESPDFACASEDLPFGSGGR